MHKEDEHCSNSTFWVEHVEVVLENNYNGQMIACTVGVQQFLARKVTHLLIISVRYYFFCFVLFSSPIQLFTWVVRIINLGTLMNNMNNYPLIFPITGLRGQIIQAKILPYKGAQRPINIFMSLGQGQKTFFNYSIFSLALCLLVSCKSTEKFNTAFII